MCGRFNVTDNPDVQALLKVLGIDIGPLPVRYNIAPTEEALVIHNFEGERVFSSMRWWLTPHWSDGPSTKYSMFNARSENIEKSPAYRGPFRYRRSIMPASSFIEWKRAGSKKMPYLISPKSGAFAFAAVWDSWTDGDTELYSCSMLTAESTPEFSRIHHRMPVMLSLDQAQEWLNDDLPLEEAKSLTKQMPLELVATPISTSINNARNKETPDPAGESEQV